MVITIAGKKHWLWRAVDQDDLVLDVLVQSRRDKHAAKRLLRKLLRRQGQPPRVLITDKLASYPAAKKELMPGVEHRRHKGPGREFKPADPAARTADEAVQIRRSGTAVTLGP